MRTVYKPSTVNSQSYWTSELKVKAVLTFEMPGTTHPVTPCHMLEAWNLHSQYSGGGSNLKHPECNSEVPLEPPCFSVMNERLCVMSRKLLNAILVAYAI
jgi:hypothetical protein